MFVSALPDGDGNEQFDRYCVLRIQCSSQQMLYPFFPNLWNKLWCFGIKAKQTQAYRPPCVQVNVYTEIFLSRSFAHIYFLWPALKRFITHEWASLQHLICSAGPLRWHYNCSLSHKHPYSIILLNILFLFMNGERVPVRKWSDAAVAQSSDISLWVKWGKTAVWVS